MKSLTKVFVALLLAVTIAFSGFQTNANADETNADFATPAASPVSITIDVNQTIDQILGLITSKQDFQLVVANQTNDILTRVGAYNSLSNWPLGDVASLEAQFQDWTENGFGYFSFASNYAVGNTGKYFQFGASWPSIGSRKINLCTLNESGNKPAQKCWDAMSNSDDKNLTNSGFTGRAIMAKNNGKVQWAYQIRKQ
ncbi:MAG: hypothetical protein C6Y22_25490 [Hapalosiphonaceae cyanobacterium JJU2]|nr:MAG: hypothetical protein C6Y22_25490 [Hapalosiphonaceae cyanobacterium JJU2]